MHIFQEIPILTLHVTKAFDLFFKMAFNNSDIHGKWGYYPQHPLLIVGGLNFKFSSKL